MFGLSLSKILLTAAVILAVWYGFKYVGRLGRPSSRSAASATVEDLRKCEVCGTFVAAGAAPACNRDDCLHR